MRVSVGVTRVTVGASGVPAGNVPNASLVGVSVGEGGSRVGMGAWVGVASSVPGGNGRMVGGGFVTVAPIKVGMMGVGVAARGIRLGRARILTVPAQYITSAPMTAMKRQP